MRPCRPLYAICSDIVCTRHDLQGVGSRERMEREGCMVALWDGLLACVCACACMFAVLIPNQEMN